ncbi:MAG: GNAT family N-acetyltransferase [Oscillospiraceae bacterium]|nr:GNAT family N-acetyltransferase [Oscillospiraceae bacterium]
MENIKQYKTETDFFIRKLCKSASCDLKAQTIAVAELAARIWTEHYTPIIGIGQVEYMLGKFQNAEQIYTDIQDNGYIYFAAEKAPVQHHKTGGMVGYCAVVPQDEHLLLSKLYTCKEYRRKGIAKSFLRKTAALCREEFGFDKIRLTVNKNNNETTAAYKIMGFITVGSVKTDIGGGFFMDDYVMEIGVTELENL